MYIILWLFFEPPISIVFWMWMWWLLLLLLLLLRPPPVLVLLTDEPHESSTGSAGGLRRKVTKCHRLLGGSLLGSELVHSRLPISLQLIWFSSVHCIAGCCQLQALYNELSADASIANCLHLQLGEGIQMTSNDIRYKNDRVWSLLKKHIAERIGVFMLDDCR